MNKLTKLITLFSILYNDFEILIWYNANALGVEFMNFSGTFIALVPPLLAIILGITTKKVNLSLIIGIIVGVLLYS